MGFFSSILDILFPRKCVFCARILNKNDDNICDNCIEALPYTNDSGKLNGEVFDFCVSPLYYTDVVRKSILRYKFGGAEQYADTYGFMLADLLIENPDINYDIITWVPLSKKREQERGYDQAKLIAQVVAQKLGKTAESVLTKHRDVRAQSELGDRVERSDNIHGAYTVLDPDFIQNKSILLIDDVITTGSTLDECAKTLRTSGAKEVICATLARSE